MPWEGPGPSVGRILTFLKLGKKPLTSMGADFSKQDPISDNLLFIYSFILTQRYFYFDFLERVERKEGGRERGGVGRKASSVGEF